MRETQIIEKIRNSGRLGHRDREIIQSIGDDCAILRPNPNEDLVFTSDFTIEDRHFTLETHTAADIGHTALARSLSDLAAMGADPAFCLVSLALPAKLGSRWVDRFYQGFLALATKNKIELAGGDLARSDHVIADVTCCGRVPRGQAMLRSAAQAEDEIFVTGLLGASAHALVTGQDVSGSHLRPEPRIRAGIALRRLGVRAGMDLSDGLSLDLYRLCVESYVEANLDSNLPIAPGATIEQALHGGEDYELLFTAPSRVWVPRKIDDIPVTRIGVIRAGRPGQIRFKGRILKPKGFDHFHESSR